MHIYLEHGHILMGAIIGYWILSLVTYHTLKKIILESDVLHISFFILLKPLTYRYRKLVTVLSCILKSIDTESFYNNPWKVVLILENTKIETKFFILQLNFWKTIFSNSATETT